MMTYEQIVEIAKHYKLSQTQAENFAMNMILQGISQKELIISALCKNSCNK